MRKAMKISSFLVAVGALALTALPAFAGGSGVPPLSPLPAGISDMLSVYDGNGKLQYSVTLTETAEETLNNPQKIFSIKPNKTLTFDTTQFDHPTTLLNPDLEYSDQFGVYRSGIGKAKVYVLGFMSDTEQSPLLLNRTDPNLLLDEKAGIYSGNATRYLAKSLQAKGWTATFQSDVETPEPASLTLLGLGAVGLFGYGYRRRKLALA